MSTNGAAEPGLDPMAVVEAWRVRGEAAVDPVRFSVIEALARRAAAQQGEARGLMVRRIEALLGEQASARPALVAPTDATPANSAADQPAAQQAALAALSELVDRLGRSSASPLPLRSPPQPGAARQADAQSRTAPPPKPLKTVTEFKGTWSRLRVEHRLRQALAQVPASAGPLNSSHLVNRALLAMRDLSPEYLDAFMSHIDTLQWLDQASGGGEPGARTVAATETKRRPVARALRKN